MEVMLHVPVNRPGLTNPCVLLRALQLWLGVAFVLHMSDMHKGLHVKDKVKIYSTV